MYVHAVTVIQKATYGVNQHGDIMEVSLYLFGSYWLAGLISHCSASFPFVVISSETGNGLLGGGPVVFSWQ